MAATNFTPIQLYHSTTAAAVPVNTNLVNGELAINITDGKLYYKDNGGTVQVIATKATGTIGGSDTQVQYNSSGALAGSSNFTFNGTTATINTLNLTNALGATYGGTAQSSWTTGDLLYASGSNTLAKLGIGLNTYILTSNGSIPGWAAPSAISVNTATNLAGGAAGSVPYQSGAGATTFLSIGTANQVITSSGSAPQWSSGLSITTLTASDAVTFSATTQNIALGTSQTSGTFTAGGAAQTGTQTVGQSTKTHTLNIGTGATESGATKTINIGTGGVSTSTTAITIGSANGTTITVNGTVNASTLDLTNLEVTNIKAKDGTASMTLADTTGIITLSATAGTANGVLYLNGSRAVTSGSALTFDGTNLSSTGGATLLGGPIGYGGGEVVLGPTTSGVTSAVLTQAAGAPILFFDHRGTSNTGVFAWRNGTGGANELMRLNGSSLNIGGNFTSTNNTLQITGNAAIGYTTAAPTTGLIVAGNVGIGASSPQGPLEVAATGATVNQFLTGGTGNNAVTGIFRIGSGTGRGASIQGFRGASSNIHSLDFYTYNSADVFGMRLDSSGNLGLGVTPSAWGSYKAIQVNSLGISGSNGDGGISFNGYYDGSNWKYIGTGQATLYNQYQGQHRFFTSASGSAGGTISLSQAMTLNASGNLGIGETNPGWKLQVNGSAGVQTSNANAAEFHVNNTSASARDWVLISSGSSWAGGGQTGYFNIYDNTASQQRLTIDTSGNLGLGVTSPAFKLDMATTSGDCIIRVGNGTSQARFAVDNDGPYIYALTSGDNSLRVFSASGSQAMTLDASGNLLLGETARAYLSRFTLSYDPASTNGPIFLDNRAFGIDRGGSLWLGGRYNSSNDYRPYGGITARKENATDGNSAGYLTFQTNGNAADPTERARITAGGYFKASNNGTYVGSTDPYHELRSTDNNANYVLQVRSAAATSTNSFGIRISYDTTPNTTGAAFLACDDSTANRATIRSNGGLANYQSNNVDLSDIRTKTDISPLASYWNKIAALEIVTYKYKDQTHDDLNIGVIAQQVEQVAPEFVDPDGFGETPEDGVPLKTIYNKDLTFAAIKALQEAMARIEKLEAEVAALKGA